MDDILNKDEKFRYMLLDRMRTDCEYYLGNGGRNARDLWAGGELNPKYPGGVEAQKIKLEAEGHVIARKGRTNIKYYVRDFEKSLFPMK